MKYSKQRELILSSVQESHSHPTADNVYAKLLQELPHISLGTVYRNLNLLSQNGDIIKILMPNASDRFDGRLDAHYHMICDRCECVADAELDLLDNLDELILEQNGFLVTEHDLIIHGICKECGLVQEKKLD